MQTEAKFQKGERVAWRGAQYTIDAFHGGSVRGIYSILDWLGVIHFAYEDELQRMGQ